MSTPINSHTPEFTKKFHDRVLATTKQTGTVLLYQHRARGKVKNISSTPVTFHFKELWDAAFLAEYNLYDLFPVFTESLLRELQYLRYEDPQPLGFSEITQWLDKWASPCPDPIPADQERTSWEFPKDLTKEQIAPMVQDWFFNISPLYYSWLIPYLDIDWTTGHIRIMCTTEDGQGNHMRPLDNHYFHNTPGDELPLYEIFPLTPDWGLGTELTHDHSELGVYTIDSEESIERNLEALEF